jgi:hypothetical protein
MRIKHSEGNYSEAVALVPYIERNIDETLNDHDKEFVCPAGEIWRLNAIFVKYVSDATVGNRQVVAEVQNAAGSVLGRISAGAVQAASLTRYYMFMQGTFRETAFVNGDIQVPIPQDSYILSGSKLRVYDSANVAAGDDMTVAYSIERMKGA